MRNDAKSIELLKRPAVAKTLEFERNGMILELGTGSKSLYSKVQRAKKLV